MRPARLRLKRANGWFAAGREMEQALFLLSDGTFRLYVWICLHADRSTGSLDADPAQLARVLGKSADEIVRDLAELARLEVCRIVGAHIVIQDRFWPYERFCSDADTAQAGYVSTIKHEFLRHACVRASFTAADEKLALEWQRRGISVKSVERAILLGVARKYTALLNHDTATPITTLEYFAGIITELDQTPVAATYWPYVERKVQRLEGEYRQRNHGTLRPPATETK